MTGGLATFRKRDLEQAVAILQKAGLEIARVEIERGKVVIHAGKPGELPTARPNAFDNAEL
jgi:hypothetical protein